MAAGFTIAQSLRMCGGLLVWSSAFVFLYAGFSLGCKQLAPDPADGLANPVTGILAAIFALHLLALAGLGWLWWKHPVPPAADEPDSGPGFRHWVEGMVLVISTAGLIWIAFPVFMVAPCTG